MIKEIPNYDGYFISDDGKVYCNIGRGTRRDRGIIKEIPLYEVKARVARNGYQRIYARNTVENKRKDLYIHRLVAQAFIPNPNNYKVINHKDTNRANNSKENLEWCTSKYNNNYTMQLGHMIRDNLGRFQSGLKPNEDITNEQ